MEDRVFYDICKRQVDDTITKTTEKTVRNGMGNFPCRFFSYSFYFGLKVQCRVPEMLRKLIMEQEDLEILRKWHKIAARAETIEDFEEKIGLVKER